MKNAKVDNNNTASDQIEVSWDADDPFASENDKVSKNDIIVYVRSDSY